jgi:hypothetical protein
MISLHDEDSGQLIGTIDEEQLQFLIDELEEEGVADQDYAITPLLLEVWENEKKQPELRAMLKKALGNREEMNLVWEKK